MAAARQKILIVDDDSNIAELISLYLMKEFYETRIVGDGEEALAAVGSFEPDLILLDLMLPGMDGYQPGGSFLKRYADHHALRQGRDLRQSARPGDGCRRLHAETL